MVTTSAQIELATSHPKFSFELEVLASLNTHPISLRELRTDFGEPNLKLIMKALKAIQKNRKIQVFVENPSDDKKGGRTARLAFEMSGPQNKECEEYLDEVYGQ